MAEYLILIYENEAEWATAAPEVYQQVMDAHNRFAEQVPEDRKSTRLNSSH